MKKLTHLVLGRRFGDSIELTNKAGSILAIVRVEQNRSGGGVRLVVSAPQDVRIERVGGVGERAVDEDKEDD